MDEHQASLVADPPKDTKDGRPSSEDERQPGSPSSRFTAVNGRDSTASISSLASAEGRRHSGGPSARTPPIYRGPEDQPKGDWGRHPTNGDTSRGSMSSLLNHAQPQRLDDSNKRKRSESLDKNTNSGHLNQGMPSPTKQLPSIESALNATSAENRGGSPPYPLNHDARPESSASAGYYRHGSYEERAYPVQRASSPNPGNSSDAQLAEALQRDSREHDNNQRGRAESMDDDDSRSSAQRATDYANDRTSSGIQIDHKRRKRVFSNRTKTGCMTCRRRKKKCDETKPECNNCVRGGFVCEGYNSRVEWQKSSNAKVPIPLQSKEGEQSSPPEHSPAATTHGLSNGMSQPSTRELQHSPVFRGPPRGPHGASTRPIMVDDDRPPMTSPDRRPTSDSWGKPAWTSANAANHSAYPAEQRSRTDYPRVQSLHDGRLEAGVETTPHSALSNRSLLHPSHSNSPQTPQQAQARASLALQQTAANSRIRTEKEKMLAGELYFASDPVLVNERERCKAACWRFNNSTNPSMDVSREERARLFRKILQPEDGGRGGAIGHVGEGVIVEAPLTCDYGYNINIGDEVCIGAHCTILDTCSVTIEERCILGPNVNLYTTTLPIDPRRRRGSQGPSGGKPIKIEKDCWIGGGVTILPGLTIGRSSVVGAASVVTRNVPAFTVVGGNPARVIRGIYRDANEI